MITLYQNTLSVVLSILFGKGCRFTPTCSEFAKQAFHTHGAFKGTLFTLNRLTRCHPLGSHGYDPVPKSH